MKYYIAVDLGATSGRVILATVGEDKKVEMETLHRFPEPLIEKDGKFYWDINDIFANILKGLAVAGERKVKIESMGIDTWGVDFVGIKADGGICGLPRSYRDPYSNPAMEEFFTKMSREELYERSGIQIMNLNSVFQLYAQSKAGDLKDADKILFMPDALSYMLTGNKVCEYTILSTSSIMDPRTKKIDEKIVGVCGLTPDKFAEIVYPGHTVGTLKKEFAELTGVGEIKVMAVAGHDTASVVAAVPAKDEHFAYLSSGTWSLMGIETKEPVINKQMYELNFTNEGGVGGTTRLLKNITGLWIMEQCLAVFRKEGRTYTWKEIEKLSLEAGESANLINPDAPEFAAPTNMPLAIKEYMEKRGWKAPETDGQYFRLIYDSLAGRCAEVFGFLKEIAPFSIDALHIVGGGSQNDVICSLTAKACGVKVVAGPGEGTALGNIMIQAGLRRNEIIASINTKIYE